MLRVKLSSLDDDNARRRRLAEIYREELAGHPCLPALRPGAEHVYRLFVVADDARELWRERLRAEGVLTMIHYPAAVHQQPAYRGRLPVRGELFESERAARRVLSLPIFPELSEADARRAARAAARAAHGAAPLSTRRAE